MIIVLLLQVMERGVGRLGGQGVGIIFFLFFFSVFVLLLIVVSWLVHDSLLCLFNCSFFGFFVSGPFN